MMAIATAWLGCLALFLELVWRALRAEDRDQPVGGWRTGPRRQGLPNANDRYARTQSRASCRPDGCPAIQTADWTRPGALEVVDVIPDRRAAIDAPTGAAMR